MVLNPIRSSPGMPILHFESSKVGWAFSKTRICAIYGYGLGSGKGTETLAVSRPQPVQPVERVERVEKWQRDGDLADQHKIWDIEFAFFRGLGDRGLCLAVTIHNHPQIPAYLCALCVLCG